MLTRMAIVLVFAISVSIASQAAAAEPPLAPEPKLVHSFKTELFFESIAFSPDSRYLAVDAGNHARFFNRSWLTVHDTSTWKEVVRHVSPGRCYHLPFSPDSKRLIASGGDSDVLEIPGGKVVGHHEYFPRFYLADGKRVVVPSGKGIELHDAETGKLLETVLPKLDSPGRSEEWNDQSYKRWLNLLVLSPDRKHILAMQKIDPGGYESEIHPSFLVDCETWTMKPVFADRNISDAVWLTNSLCTLGDIYSGEPGIELYDVRTGAIKRVGQSIGKGIGTHVRLGPDLIAYRVSAGNKGNTAHFGVLDVRRNERIALWKLDGKAIFDDFAASEDGKFLAVRGDSRIYVWRIDEALAAAQAAAKP